MRWTMPRQRQWWITAATMPSSHQYRQPPLPAFNLANQLPSSLPPQGNIDIRGGGQNEMDNAVAAAVVARSCHCAVATSISTTPLPAFNPANRVDLIAHTIAQLTQFRIIQRRHNEEIQERNEEVQDIK